MSITHEGYPHKLHVFPPETIEKMSEKNNADLF